MHTQIWSELANVTASHSLLSLKGHGDQGRFLRTWRKKMPLFEQNHEEALENCSQPHLRFWEADEVVYVSSLII